MGPSGPRQRASSVTIGPGGRTGQRARAVHGEGPTPSGVVRIGRDDPGRPGQTTEAGSGRPRAKTRSPACSSAREQAHSPRRAGGVVTRKDWLNSPGRRGKQAVTGEIGGPATTFRILDDDSSQSISTSHAKTESGVRVCHVLRYVVSPICFISRKFDFVSAIQLSSSYESCCCPIAVTIFLQFSTFAFPRFRNCSVHITSLVFADSSIIRDAIEILAKAIDSGVLENRDPLGTPSAIRWGRQIAVDLANVGVA